MMTIDDDETFSVPTVVGAFYAEVKTPTGYSTVPQPHCYYMSSVAGSTGCLYSHRTFEQQDCGSASAVVVTLLASLAVRRRQSKISALNTFLYRPVDGHSAGYR